MKKPRLLLVDDDALISESLAYALAPEYEVARAGDREAAVRTLREGPAPQLALIDLGLPPLAPQAPWHGYSLGVWDAAWDTYARRAVTGEWEQSGIETFAQRRGGFTPETPVRDVADPSRGME